MSHAERAHALLSASGAKKWIACPPSARLEDQMTDESSEHAQAGTLAHEISEQMLRCEIGEIKPATLKKKITQFKKNDLFDEEMIDYCKQYVDLVMERYHAAIAVTPDAKITIEERLDFSEWVPDGFGTGDVLIVADTYVEVIDLKYGKGIKVDAVGNPQMRLYGLGAYAAYADFYDFKEVKATVIQPRLDHVDTETLTVFDLLAWAEDVVMPAAKLADKGEGEFCAGTHCTASFCKVRETCRARAQHNLEMAKYDFKEGPLLTHDEIAEILTKADELQKWAGDIQKYALKEAECNGVKFPGWKLVEGRSNRKYEDEDAVATSLEMEGFGEDQIYNKKIKGVTELTKALGKSKFETYVGPYIIKPPGRPCLVTESDKRPELNTFEANVKDFE